MADMGSSLALHHAVHTTPLSSAVQQADGVTVNNGSFVQAGGSVTISNNYTNLPEPTIDLGEVLRLVPNLRRIHLDVLSKATFGTCVWILKTHYFILWLDLNGDLKILWGTGIPGAGKTVMASVVINDLEARAGASDGKVCVAYVYFRYSDAANLTVRAVLEILVKQSVERNANCEAAAQKVYAQHKKDKTEPTEAELLRLLHTFTTEATEATFYVLDALDEAPEKLQLDLIKKLASLRARLFITSRPLKAVESRIASVHSFPIVAQDDDLDLHVSQELSRSRDLQDLLDEDPSFKDEVLRSIKANCGGMFLHASLQLDAICRCSSAQDVLDTLEEFPSDIQNVHNHTWRRICSQTERNVLLAKRMLMWVLNATRSMTIEELRRAVATHPITHKFERRRLVSPATLVTLCCGMLTLEEESGLVRLVHYTAKDMIQQLLLESFPRPHSLLAAVCTVHLSQCGFQSTTLSSEGEYMEVLQLDPLLAYASEAWVVHVRHSLADPSYGRQLIDFIGTCQAFPTFTRPGTFDIVSRLHLLAIHNFPLSLIPQDDISNPNPLTKIEEWTPLMIASFHGWVGMVQDLLYLKGIELNLVDDDGYSALIHAAEQGHEGVVKLLVACPDLDVNVQDEVGLSALINVTINGDIGMVKLLLSRSDILVNLIDSHEWTALMRAANLGHEDILKLLLARPEIDVNLTEKVFRDSIFRFDALVKAAYNGHKNIVRLLLDHPGTIVTEETCRRLAYLLTVDKEGWAGLMVPALTEEIVDMILASVGLRRTDPALDLVDGDDCSDSEDMYEDAREGFSDE